MAKIKDLSKEITKQLALYSKEIEEEMQTAKNDLSKEAVSLLREKSPKKHGEYAQGWTRKKVGNDYVIYNKKYQLTHLLENYHAKKGGGRVPARPHIRPVEEQIIDEYLDRTAKAIKQ